MNFSGHPVQIIRVIVYVHGGGDIVIIPMNTAVLVEGARVFASTYSSAIDSIRCRMCFARRRFTMSSSRVESNSRRAMSSVAPWWRVRCVRHASERAAVAVENNMPTAVTVQNLYVFNSTLSKTEEDVSSPAFTAIPYTTLRYSVPRYYSHTSGTIDTRVGGKTTAKFSASTI